MIQDWPRRCDEPHIPLVGRRPELVFAGPPIADGAGQRATAAAPVIGRCATVRAGLSRRRRRF